MARFWFFFFMLWAAIAVGSCVIAPSMGWWFPEPGKALSPLGTQIDDLFHLILVITSLTFIGTHIVLGYVLWKFGKPHAGKGWFTHGSHNLEVVWTIVPAGVLLFIALFQMDVWARFRVKSNFDREAMLAPLAEVTARQFEWRIRYPNPSRKFASQKEVDDWLAHPQPDDLYTVNDLHAPIGRPVVIHLRSEDVLHSFFLPHLRVKQDAVPGLVIPVWFHHDGQPGGYELVCAELCGWGHYKMRGQLTTQFDDDFEKYLHDLAHSQFDDGVAPPQVAEK